MLAVRGRAQGGGHLSGDLLRRQAGATAVNGERPGHAGPRHPAVRRQLLQRLRHAHFLLLGTNDSIHGLVTLPANMDEFVFFFC